MLKWLWVLKFYFTLPVTTWRRLSSMSIKHIRALVWSLGPTETAGSKMNHVLYVNVSNLYTVSAGWNSSVRAWRWRWTTSCLPSQRSMPSVVCSRTPCCSAAPAPAPSTSAFAPAGTIEWARWRYAGTVYDQRRMEALFSRRLCGETAVTDQHWLHSLTSDLTLAASG